MGISGFATPVAEVIKLALNPEGGRRYRYRLAGQRVETDFNTPALAASLVIEPSAPAQTRHYQGKLASVTIEVAREPRIPQPTMKVWLGGRLRTVEWVLCGSTALLTISNIGEFILSAQHGLGAVLKLAPNIDPDTLLQVALGPLLSVLLAERGVFCLHASCALTDEGAVCFTGESGVGKSTLAAYLAERGLPLLADDVVPIRLTGGRVWALPDFPQLKLSPEKQPMCRYREPIPVCSVLKLDESESLQLEKLSASQAALMVASNTVAARLFWPSLLGRHLDFCLTAATQMAAYSLSYPRELSDLPKIDGVLRSIFDKDTADVRNPITLVRAMD